MNTDKPIRYLMSIIWISTLFLQACGGGSSSSSSDASQTEESAGTLSETVTIDITDAIFTETSGDCADYVNVYEASVVDITRSLGFEADVDVRSSGDECTLVSNNIPNHNFNDNTASFASDVAEIDHIFTIPRNPVLASAQTELSQPRYDAVMLNGVVLDILSAGCYKPDDPMADADGNVPVGCTTADPWLLDPLGTDSKFGADMHNAHVQPGVQWHRPRW